MKHKVIIIVWLLLLCVSSLKSYANTDLAVIRQLAKDGAPELASKLISQAQPKATDNINGWVFFEEQRFELLRYWQEWDEIIERTHNVPIKAPIGFMRYAYLQRVNAFLNTNHPEQAIPLLQQLIWGDESDAARAQQQMYRRLLIRAYWLQRQYNDVARAIKRFEQDYGVPNNQWRILKSRVLMHRKQYADVIALLSNVPEAEGQAILALAKHQQTPKNKKLSHTLFKQTQSKELLKTAHPADKVRLRLTGAEVSQLFKTNLSRTRSLEAIVPHAQFVPKADELFVFDSKVLWQAYLDYGYKDANEQQMLVGDDAKWFKRASIYLKKYPEKSRAIYAVVIKDSPNEDARTKAFTLFVKSLGDDKKGILPYLFSPQQGVLEWSRVPDDIRFILVNSAIKKSDYDLAGKILQTLKTPPEGVSDLVWGLQQARIKVLNAQPKQSAKRLLSLIEMHKAELDKPNLDRIAQVVFDLQAVKAHREAVDVLAALLLNPMPAESQRELLFWLADSFKALKEYPQAAAYYLRSATLLDGVGYDIWGQTARYQAAEVLLEAELYRDAERQLLTLLKVTEDARRRALLNQQIQQARLKLNNAESPNN